MNIHDAKGYWRDTPEGHTKINEEFTRLVNEDSELRLYRDWIEQRIFGFGERSFLWMWKLLVDEMPPSFKFLEIGVFRGQIIGLVSLLTNRTGRESVIRGVTPLDSTDGHWESDYAADIKLLHFSWGLKQPEIIKGLSTSPDAISKANDMYDMVYIDGGHSYEVVQQDIKNYSPMVKTGGFLVIDDCCNKYNLPAGYFKGIESVSKAVDGVLPNEHFKELFSVVHNRVFKKV